MIDRPADGALAKLERAMTQAAAEPLVRVSGAVTELSPSHARVAGLSSFVKLGECVRFGPEAEGARNRGEVVRIDAQGVIVKTFEAGALTSLGERVFRAGPLRIAPHPGWKGRVVNAFGAPIDGAGPLPQGDRSAMIDAPPPSAMRRARVAWPLRTGVRVIDIFTPLCAGQRIGIFAGSGVGKSTLLAMLAGSKDFDTVVVALVGERGREVREFLDDALAANRPISVAVVATGDETPSMRRLAPRTAMAIAEFFRDRGDRVLLIIDSVTRFAHAARDVALAAGEPPVARGYTPSVFSDLPKLLERAGPGEEGGGSITGVFSVLVDGDDHNDPVADAVRGTLDGHIVLDRAIADQGRFPAVNVLASISRLAQIAWTAEQRDLVVKLRGMIARFEDSSDLRLMGGYKAGQDADLDQAVALAPKIYKALQQSPQSTPSADAFRELAQSLTGAS
ncbi:ATPase, FliI/YscN family [Methylocella silvestris BL2]|uniref:Flagellum-specific ATP synthase n=1 Tax=Methylocella silvestris (strain DSM 15510 / CIP 108128 / LMG 27833 / NCIMB 13906 / BL2) TaxID=395965 RepID=B8EK65_METSB|nr:flagellar protein export ATPase FliI [Methylocella silvestris]ACK50605.1 ATPase, FliI/YscN family [Methylocella silvestris BL2]